MAEQAQDPEWLFSLYVADGAPRCLTAYANLKNLCQRHLEGRYKIEVVDLLENPQLAKDEQILAIPTLVRNRPNPVRRVIGDLSQMEKVLAAWKEAEAMPYPKKGG